MITEKQNRNTKELEIAWHCHQPNKKIHTKEKELNR